MPEDGYFWGTTPLWRGEQEQEETAADVTLSLRVWDCIVQSHQLRAILELLTKINFFLRLSQMEAEKGWQWICSLSSMFQILNQICLQPCIYQVSLLLSSLNKNLVIPFQSSQNHIWERGKSRFAIDSCLSYSSKKEQRCLFQSSVVRYSTVFLLAALGSDLDLLGSSGCSY